MAISEKAEIIAEHLMTISRKAETMNGAQLVISEKAEITEFCKILAEKFGGKEKSA